MFGVLGFVLLVVLSIAFGAVTQWLKNQKLAEQERFAQRRAERDRDSRGRNESDSTVDRYVEEVERLRRRTPGESRPLPARPLPAVVPVVAPVPKRARLGDDAFTPLRPTESVLDKLPVAAVVPTRARPVGTVTPAGGPRESIAGPFADMLRSKDGLAMAVLLHEVFGPPRCRGARVVLPAPPAE